MTNQLPYEGPLGDDDPTEENSTLDERAGGETAGLLDPALGGDDRPLDPDLDDDQIDSAAADERAATEGVIDVDDRP
jgi:hypothetical protein